MEKSDVLRNIIIRVLSIHTDIDENTKQLISAEILAKLIHKTTFQEEENETKSSQNKDTDKGIAT